MQRAFYAEDGAKREAMLRSLRELVQVGARPCASSQSVSLLSANGLLVCRSPRLLVLILLLPLPSLFWLALSG